MAPSSTHTPATGPHTSVVNIVIIDKSAVQRLGLMKLISESMQEVALTGFNNVQEIVQVPGQRSDLVMLCLSQADPLDENVRQLKMVSGQYPEAKILVLETVRGLQTFRNLLAYLKLGVSGYVTAFDPLENIEHSIRKVLAGKRYVGEEALEWLLDHLANEEVATYLTANELDVARLLAEGRSVSRIARETNRKISTISTIKRSILRKTNVSNLLKLGEILSRQSDPELAGSGRRALSKKRLGRFQV